MTASRPDVGRCALLSIHTKGIGKRGNVCVYLVTVAVISENVTESLPVPPSLPLSSPASPLSPPLPSLSLSFPLFPLFVCKIASFFFLFRI